jgi:hypothetical protein
MCRLSPTSEVGPWGRYLCHPETRRPSVQTASIPQCTSSVTAPTRPNADTLTFGTMGRPDLTMNGAPSSAPMPRLLPTSPTPLSAQTTRISDGVRLVTPLPPPTLLPLCHPPLHMSVSHRSSACSVYYSKMMLTTTLQIWKHCQWELLSTNTQNLAHLSEYCE